MNYEERMKKRIDALARNISDEKVKIWMNLMKYKTSDITKDQDIFFHVNADRMSMEDFINKRADRFEQDRINLKTIKEGLIDKKYGETKDKHFRWLGDIPDTIWFTHPWFSPMLPKEERDKNIRRFFNLFPQFRMGDKPL